MIGTVLSFPKSENSFDVRLLAGCCWKERFKKDLRERVIETGLSKEPFFSQGIEALIRKGSMLSFSFRRKQASKTISY